MSKDFLSINSENHSLSIPSNRIAYTRVEYIPSDDKFQIVISLYKSALFKYFTKYGAIDSESPSETCKRLSNSLNINLDSPY